MKTRTVKMLCASVLALALSLVLPSCAFDGVGQPAAPDVNELAEAASSLSLLTDLPPERILDALARASAPVSQPPPEQMQRAVPAREPSQGGAP